MKIGQNDRHVMPSGPIDSDPGLLTKSFLTKILVCTSSWQRIRTLQVIENAQCHEPVTRKFRANPMWYPVKQTGNEPCGAANCS